MKKTIAYILLLVACPLLSRSQWIADKPSAGRIPLSRFSIYLDSAASPVLQTAARMLQRDIELVSGIKLQVTHSFTAEKNQIIIATVSALIAKQLVHSVDSLPSRWEESLVRSIVFGKNKTLQVLCLGTDPRGAAFAVMDLCRQAGVSPWYWWADVPVRSGTSLFVNPAYHHRDAPAVKYRGIFINDEAPALSNWAKEKMGGFNHRFYDKVFELLLRLKANYVWPAMWGNAFYDDDPANIDIANKYGIVIGTSHHEPMMRAHDEWRRYHKGSAWNYATNADTLRSFWKKGLTRADNEKIITVGMRGDGDEPMSRETATELLEKIVTDQRSIIAEVTGKSADQSPQLWALYKEVQDYYDKGMRVPDDVTLLLCDDNWGNIRRLPRPGTSPRKGGYGMYYHFDYVGGPRNYKWINTNPLPRIWEQMQLAWQHDVRDIWIVNVGDIKPMELPISFFLDLAWSPEAMSADGIQPYTKRWAAEQLGSTYSSEIADMLAAYAKFNSRRKPELLSANTYSLLHGEWDTVINQYNRLLAKASAIHKKISPKYRDAYYQLVLHPVKASANLNELYYHVAKNREAEQNLWSSVNVHAATAYKRYTEDSLITLEYHRLNNGKWNHMMSQTHIGYTYWQQPEKQTMPEVVYVLSRNFKQPPTIKQPSASRSVVPSTVRTNSFYEISGRGISMHADHFSRKTDAKQKLVLLPDHGRTGSAIGHLSVTPFSDSITGDTPLLEYDFYPSSSGICQVTAFFSPTLNLFNHKEGIRYAIAIDDEPRQIISINKEDTATGSGIWNKWVAENIIRKKTFHNTSTVKKHTLKIWLPDAGAVLQKLVINYGKPDESYLGQPETLFTPKKSSR